MFSTVKLLDVQYIKDHTEIQQLVDEQVLNNYILPSQDLYIKPILGTQLYDQLVSAYTANGNTDSITGLTSGLTYDYQILLDQVRPVLAYYTYWQSYSKLVFKVTKIGVEKRMGDNLNPIDDNTIFKMKKEILEYTKSIALILEDFVKDNKANYGITDETNTKIKAGINGFYFGNGKSC